MTNKIYSLKDTQNLSKNSEFLFLVIAISFGLLYALFQPLFFEPDSSYHFDKSMYLSNTVVDRTTVNFSGEDYQSQPIPFTTISNMKQQGVYYKNFFETELPLISKKMRIVGLARIMELSKIFTGIMTGCILYLQ